ncbi:MAG: hypothetical protein WCD02_03030 [Terriglobales bacterium]
MIVVALALGTAGTIICVLLVGVVSQSMRNSLHRDTADMRRVYGRELWPDLEGDEKQRRVKGRWRAPHRRVSTKSFERDEIERLAMLLNFEIAPLKSRPLPQNLQDKT